MAKWYIGLATTLHDSALAIVNKEGDVVFAEATERYLQNKRSMGIPPDIFNRVSHLISTYCPDLTEVVVGYSWSESAADNFITGRGGLKEIEKAEQDSTKLFGDVPSFMRSHVAGTKYLLNGMVNVLASSSSTLEFELALRDDLPYRTIVSKHKFDHHLSHAATACYTSGFSEGLCIVIDGFGESRAYNGYSFKNGRLTSLPELTDYGYGSLGGFYSTLCTLCGFGYLTGEEWKVMGLAAYGQFDKKIYDILKSVVWLDGLKIEMVQGPGIVAATQKLFTLARKNGEPAITMANLAYTGQFVYVELLNEFLRNVQKLGISKNLILGGGCMLNSSANGQILEHVDFEKIHIFSAPGDDGNAIGAALLAYMAENPEASRPPKIQHPYLGSEINWKSLEYMKEFSALPIEYYPGEVHKKVVDLLIEGKIIGWMQGRAEFGPRALGNRSILADPRSPDMKDRINARVKFREEFRPFAPSVLEEFAHEYFECYQDTPYMEKTLRFKPEVRDRVPAVVHEDGTGRLQTVRKDWNNKYYTLIKEFYDRTGVPIVLNTSFNVMGKPIIHTVEDALATFFTSGLDALVIDDYLIVKK